MRLIHKLAGKTAYFRGELKADGNGDSARRIAASCAASCSGGTSPCKGSTRTVTVHV